jgi:phosphohistidine phosphatase SixA
MKILLVRHSKPVEKEFWQGDLSSRPLCKAGHFRAGIFAKQLVKLYRHDIDCLITSDFTKALETAEYIRKELKPRKYEINKILNPGVDFPNFQILIKSLPASVQSVVLVGHCPDLSNIAGELISNKNIAFYFKKPSLIEIEIDESFTGRYVQSCSLDDSQKLPFKNREPYYEEVGEFYL